MCQDEIPLSHCFLKRRDPQSLTQTVTLQAVRIGAVCRLTLDARRVLDVFNTYRPMSFETFFLRSKTRLNTLSHLATAEFLDVFCDAGSLFNTCIGFTGMVPCVGCGCEVAFRY